MNEIIQKRTKTILILSFLFFVSGIIFFFNHRAASSSPAIPYSPSTSQFTLLKHMPEPKTYQAFTYKKQDSFEVSGTCKDTYYTILVYPSKIDYRENVSSAIFNRAFPCYDKKDFNVTIAAKDMPLMKGQSYYIIRAHQGVKNSWYEPY